MEPKLWAFAEEPTVHPAPVHKSSVMSVPEWIGDRCPLSAPLVLNSPM